jgi:hypothetical protein
MRQRRTATAAGVWWGHRIYVTSFGNIDLRIRITSDR